MFKMQIVNEVMFFLESGNWFSLEEIMSKCSFPQCNIELVLNFLKQSDFLQVDDKKQVFRLESNVLDFINILKKS